MTLSSVSQRAAGVNQPKKSLIDETMANADKALTTAQVASLESLLKKHSSAFPVGSDDLRRSSLILHNIDTGEGKPIRQGMRRIPHEQIPLLKGKIDKLQKAGAIEPSISPFASFLIFVCNKDGTMRLCINYRQLNAITKKDAHPLPKIKEIFDTLSGSKFFTTQDMTMGYHQVEVHTDDREKTAFTTPFCLFQYKVIPFGLATAQTTFIRLMTILFSGMLYNTCLTYLDDIIIFGKTFVEHLERLDRALTRVQNANLKLKPNMCQFGKTSLATSSVTKGSAQIVKNSARYRHGSDRVMKPKHAVISVMPPNTESLYETFQALQSL